MNREIAADYIRENFEPTDRLAVVLLHKGTNQVIQRLASAENMAAPDFQAWLSERNARGYEVYISMNALRPDALGRTKQDVETIRHIFLDFDQDGTAAMQALLNRTDLPAPHGLLRTSPGKGQVSWKVEGFGKPEAEELQRSLARETGADPAATDCARVLRLPGYDNHKYGAPYLVEVEFLSREAPYRPDQFPKFESPGRESYAGVRTKARGSLSSKITQSEKDWAYALRSLARGESPENVAAAIASYRRYDKPDPEYYAELTVRKAFEALERAPSYEPGRG